MCIFLGYSWAKQKGSLWPGLTTFWKKQHDCPADPWVNLGKLQQLSSLYNIAVINTPVNIFALKISSLFHNCLFFAMKSALLGEPSTTLKPSGNFLGFYFSTLQVQIVFDLKRVSIVSQKEKACGSIVFMRYYFYKMHYKFDIYCQGWDKQKMSAICSCPGWACCNTRQFEEFFMLLNSFLKC